MKKKTGANGKDKEGINLSDWIPARLLDQFKQAITDQIRKMSPEKMRIAKDLLEDPAFLRVSFIVWIDPEAYQLRLKIYDQIPLIEDRGHLVKLHEKRPAAQKALSALIHTFDRCYSVDQRKLYGAKESVSRLRKAYSKEVLEKLNQGIFVKDCFPRWKQERKEDREAIHYDFHFYSKPKNKREFENLFDLAAVWSIQDAYLNQEEPPLFEKKERQKDILYVVYDPDGRNLNYKGKPYSAFLKEKFRPLIKVMAKEYSYRAVKEVKDLPDSAGFIKEVKRSEKKIEDLMSQAWFNSILNYKKGKASIPTYFKRDLHEFFFGEDKIEVIDYDLVEKRNHFIDEFIGRFIEGINLKDEVDEIIFLNRIYHGQKLQETQEVLKVKGYDISLSGVSKKESKIRKTLQKQLKMVKIIADQAHKTFPGIPEFDPEDYFQA